jgi:hypothetical protein
LLGAGVGQVRIAQALSTSDKPAGILVWPKIVVDTSGRFGPPTDTRIDIASTYNLGIRQAYCFYVNATSHCSISGAACRTSTDCASTGDQCLPYWSEIDFSIFLTQEQPLEWYASDGLAGNSFPLPTGRCLGGPLQNQPCFSDVMCPASTCSFANSNVGSAIPPVPEDPFIGSLTCIQYTGGSNSVPDQTPSRNKLIGGATIIRNTGLGGSTVADPARYSAVGLEAQGNPVSGNTLLLQDGQNYSSCPSTLILSHIFDGASDPIDSAQTYQTELTLVPCSNDFQAQRPGLAVAQFLVFNEFEQRFSTSRTVDCLLDSPLSLIDTRNPARSIFNAGVAGSIAGQTRIRGVGGRDELGSGLLGVARAMVGPALGSAAYGLHQQGNARTDVIILP